MRSRMAWVRATGETCRLSISRAASAMVRKCRSDTLGAASLGMGRDSFKQADGDRSIQPTIGPGGTECRQPPFQEQTGRPSVRRRRAFERGNRVLSPLAPMLCLNCLLFDEVELFETHEILDLLAGVDAFLCAEVGERAGVANFGKCALHRREGDNQTRHCVDAGLVTHRL